MYTLIIGKPPFETNNVKETYKRIKMGNYSFPENAVISEPAKDLIQNILALDPHKRPKLEEILNHDFFNIGINIPKTMQQSTLACPPSLNYIRQFIPNAGPNGIVTNYVRKQKTPSESHTNDFDLGSFMPDALMNSVSVVNNELVVNAIVVGAAFIAVFVILTYITFKKRDVK